MHHSLLLSRSLLIAFSVIVTIMACEKLQPAGPADNETLDGTVEGLTNAQRAQFLDGDIAFNDLVFTKATGLGPIFVANSCGSCHAADGKGTPFTTLTRFGQHDSTGNHFLHQGGPQLQNRAIPGHEPEEIPDGASFAHFTPPAVTGLGYLQYVSDADLLAMADPLDLDGDGISGVPNWRPLKDYVDIPADAVSKNGRYIHRFGKKAAAFSLLQQTVEAFNQDMGVTSTFEPVDVYSGHSLDPEVSDKTVRDIVHYLETLKAPIPRNQDDQQVANGKVIFSQLKCTPCHLPEMKTGPAPIEALANKTFHPYTDMLLHDMGSALDDGYTEGSALTSEWRTPPLWGLGLSPASQGGKYYLMHDGRATSIEDAILLHGGEAAQSKNLFQALSETEKQDLIKFLESL